MEYNQCISLYLHNLIIIQNNIYWDFKRSTENTFDIFISTFYILHFHLPFYILNLPFDIWHFICTWHLTFEIILLGWVLYSTRPNWARKVREMDEESVLVCTGLVDQQKVDLLTAQNVIFDILEPSAFWKYSTG